MNKTKKIANYTLALLLTLSSISACNQSQKVLTPQNAKANQSNLYGMCYLLEEREYDPLYQMATEVELMKNLGVKTIRQWMHFSGLLKNKTTIKESECEKMHELLALCSENGMLNIGLNHHNFNNGSDPTGKPYARDIENEQYVNWLNDYYTSWYTLVSAFPEVMYWEIDNEVNNSDFMKDANGQDAYNQQEMAELATDMFYYASRAIHDANSKAKTIMGGLTEPNGLGTGTVASFLQKLYDNIKSGEYGYFYGKESKKNASTNPDDYFEIACWHPYVWKKFDSKTFVEINNEYYQIVLDNEKKHKEVFFTEIGFNDVQSSEEMAAQYLEELFTTIENEMPYVSQVHYYKMYDVGTLNNWEGGGTYSRFGLFCDPDKSRNYPKLGTTDIEKSGRPKLKAYTFQRLSKGSGDLELLCKD